MAEIIATELIKVVFEKLADEAIKQVVRSQGIHSELKNLGKTLSKIQKLLNDASEKENVDKDVKQWLNNLQRLAYDIDDVLDELATDSKHRELTDVSRATTSKVRKLIPTCCTNISLSSRLHHKLDNIANKLQDLEKEKLDLGLMVKEETPKNLGRRNETSLPDESSIVGRHNEKEKLLQKLLGDEPCNKNFSIVPIVGMGGVGKTTLARLLYNETQVKDHFELMAWVCVSDESDIFKIGKTIFQTVTRENKEFGDLNQLQVALIEKLKDRRFLLVLDDVWSENHSDWENLIKPFHSGAPKSKIIMTTRKEQLLKKLGFDHLDHLKSLSYDDAVLLFAQHALNADNFDSHPTLKQKGECIVKKCGGLPLALRTLGRLLRTKTDKEEWDDVLNSEIWGLENVDEIVPALRLSYHDLPAFLKQLFAYSALFPKDYLFEKEELVLLWMAEGFLNESTSNKPPERLGHESFEKLLSRSFFQQAPNEESLYVMHDLLNDLATFVAGDIFLKFDNHMEMENEALTKYRHMSFLREEYVAYQKFEALKRAKSLRTFLVVSVGEQQSWEHFYLSNKILVDLLPKLSLLRVLCLSCFDINEVPEFIGSLKHLRYLNLSQTQIKYLPENVGNLYNLQTLILYSCHSLNKLPNNFLKLKNLRHFDIRDTPLLKKMPLGIGELKSLRTLTKIIIGGDSGFLLTELKELKNLHGKISIKGLEKVENAMQAQEARLSLERITELELEWGVDVLDGSRKEALEKEILNELKPNNDKLKRLEIISYGGMEFPHWVGDPSFDHLVYMSIDGCRRCTSLPPLWKLPSLKKLYIKDMNEVKFIGLELHGTGVAFPSLEILSFTSMVGWEVWSTTNSDENKVFPCLKELHIVDCPDLVKVSLRPIPSLKIVKINGCSDGALKSLVQVASLVSKLKIGYISGLTDEVWRGIIKSLGSVEKLTIGGCNEIRYLWKSEAEANNVLVKLKKLVVCECESLVRLGEKEVDNCGRKLLISLRKLGILDCNSLEHCCCPDSVEMLIIRDCSSIKSVSFPTGGGREGHTLKCLEISNCEKLMDKEFGGEKINNTSMRMLEDVCIDWLPNLKSVNELSNFIHLTDLVIQNCLALESFPDIHLQQLTSLKHMRIKKCPMIDASFPRGFWPPKLLTLEIGGLKKPMSEWGPFPTSLVSIQLFSGNMSNFSQSSHLLPSSLTSLYINGFEKLESLSMGLNHLTSLQHLVISSCPKMTRLPEMLLPSLLSLRIIGCPNMEERSRQKTSHIPCIDIY